MCRGDSSVKYTISYNYRLLICEGIFAFCKNVYIFAMHNILNGGESCHSVAGIFLPVNSIRRFRTPVWSVNAPTAVEWCYATGQAEPFIFVLIFKQKGLWEQIVIASLRVKEEVRL